MMRDRWRDIRATIKQDIVTGVLEPGTKLPTEPELSALYGAGRHSIRRAVAELGKEGYLSVEQGRGTFVQQRPRLKYSIGRRTRLRRNMAELGVEVTSVKLDAQEMPALDWVSDALRIPQGATVSRMRRRSFADGVPVSYGTIYHDIARFADFAARSENVESISAVYASFGVEDYLRSNTQIHARPARVEEAQMLGQHADMPVIVVRAVDTLVDGTPIACSEVIWSAARVTFDISAEEDGE